MYSVGFLNGSIREHRNKSYIPFYHCLIKILNIYIEIIYYALLTYIWYKDMDINN